MKSEKQLYQWDVNQYLIELQPTTEFIDYPMGNEVIRIKADGTRCRIPDEVLQTYGGKTCYERYPDGTFRACSFSVLYAPKPPDYVYTPEERTTFEALTARVDAAIEEIKRRADSGEFTPVKGVDYFTEEDKTELMEGVSSGAVGEFRKVVDTATTEYNDNHNLKLAKYNANASEKLTTYDTNAEQRTSDYNRNAEQKMEAYNSNHAAKVAEYNQNAETKTAEFDANAAALQTEVDRLRGECDQLAAENRKQENRISALMKLNKGQTYDILPEEGETVSRTAPSGAKYVSVDKVGGKSIVWNQLFNISQNRHVDGGQFEINFESQTVTLNGNSGNNAWLSVIPDDGEFKALNVKNHQYIYVISVVENQSAESVTFGWLNRARHSTSIPANYTGRANFVCTVTKPEEGKSIGFSGLQPNTDYALKIVLTACDLTLLFGAGNEPTAEQFERMFPSESYPYNAGEIISSRTATITAGAETITTGFPELRSAMAAHDYIDMDGGEIRRNVGTVDLGSLSWSYSDKYEWWESNSMIGQIVAPAGSSLAANAICNRFEIVKQNDNYIKPGVSVWTSGKISVKSDEIKSAEGLSGVTLYFEKVTPTTEQVTIPEALTEWLPVEPGGTVTFRNADESKQLPVPNGVSWVRKLDEVE